MSLIPDNVWNIVSISLVPVIFILFFCFSPRKKVPFYAVLASFLLKIIVILLNSYYIKFLPWDSDWYYLNEMAQNFAYNSSSIFQNLTEARGRLFFAWILSLQYRFLGEAIVMILVINATLNTLTAILSYKITKLLSDNAKAANIVICVVCFFPIYTVYSADPSREPLVTFAFISAAYFYTLWIKQQLTYQLVFALMFMILALSIHSAFAMIMLILMFAVVILSGKAFIFSRGKKPIMFMMSFVGLLTVTGLVLVSGWGLNKIGGDISNLSSASALGNIGSVRDGDSRTGYMPRDQVIVNSFGDFVIQSPNRIFLFITKPFPWDIRAIADILGFMLVVVHIIFFYVYLRNFSLIRKNKALNHLAICAILLTIIFSFGTANWGTAARHKSKFFPIMIIACAIVLVEKRRYSDLSVPKIISS